MLNVFGAEGSVCCAGRAEAWAGVLEKVWSKLSRELGLKCCRGISQRDFPEVFVWRLYLLGLCQKNPIVFLGDVVS